MTGDQHRDTSPSGRKRCTVTGQTSLMLRCDFTMLRCDFRAAAQPAHRETASSACRPPSRRQLGLLGRSATIRRECARGRRPWRRDAGRCAR
jgi:hypothetical protein